MFPKMQSGQLLAYKEKTHNKNLSLETHTHKKISIRFTCLLYTPNWEWTYQCLPLLVKAEKCSSKRRTQACTSVFISAACCWEWLLHGLVKYMQIHTHTTYAHTVMKMQHMLTKNTNNTPLSPLGQCLPRLLDRFLYPGIKGCILHH